jgi:IS5 family transposase
VQRQLGGLSEQAQSQLRQLLQRTGRILNQRTKDKNKLYALHAPEAECIAKGKARTPYEFGVKVSVATTLKEGLVVGMRSMPGNPCDGHTLAEALEQVGVLTGTDRLPHTAIVDRGYRGVEIEGVRILRPGQKRGVTKTLKAMIKRRSAIEPAIGHMKMDGRLGRNPLAEHVKSGYEGMLIALPNEYWPSAQGTSPQELAQRLLRLARRISPRQVATSKRKPKPKIDKPKGHVDGATARAHVLTARVLNEARGQRP